jgi:O-antigen/teichoic acid export membrane protein
VYGQFSFALALATIAEGLMDFGLHQLTIRELARGSDHARAMVRNVLGLKLLPAIVMTGAVWGIGAWLRPEADVRMACLLLGVSAIMRSYMLTARGVFQGLEDFAQDSIVAILDRALLFAASAIVLLAGGGLVALAWAFVGSRLLALVLSFWLLQRRVGSITPDFQRERWRELRRRAIPLGSFLIVLNLYSYIDTVMLGVLSTDAETGLYNGAYRLYEGLTYAVAVLSAVLTPRLSAAFVHDRVKYALLARQGVLTSVALAVVLAIGTSLVADVALIRVFGAEFAPAARALRILAVGLIVVFPIWILHAVAISATAERLLIRTTAIGVIVNVAANWWLIPAGGRDGAALATVIGEVLSLVLLLHGLRHMLLPGKPA